SDLLSFIVHLSLAICHCSFVIPPKFCHCGQYLWLQVPGAAAFSVVRAVRLNRGLFFGVDSGCCNLVCSLPALNLWIKARPTREAEGDSARDPLNARG